MSPWAKDGASPILPPSETSLCTLPQASFELGVIWVLVICSLQILVALPSPVQPCLPLLCPLLNTQLSCVRNIRDVLPSTL